MKVLLIPDKFKGSLSSEGVINAVRRGIQQVVSGVQVHCVLASDGGDGFLDSVSKNVVSNLIKVETVDPLGRIIKADYLLDPKTKTAYIELAKASGLELLSVGERKVMNCSTYGTGLQIKDAIAKGVSSIYLGLGGSATNDAGMGIAVALGYRFTDFQGKTLEPVGSNLSKIHTIHSDGSIKDLDSISFFAINDVDNPLYGSKGAAHIYAEQKGASNSEIMELDRGLRHFSKIVKQQLKKEEAELPGSGAAGGTAYGLKAFFKAQFISGIDFVLHLSKVEELLTAHHFDFIITGEGKFDNQTLHGKLIKGVVGLGKRFEIPVVVVCGQLAIDDKDKLAELGLHTVLEIKDASKPLEYNMENAELLIENSVAAFFQNR